MLPQSGGRRSFAREYLPVETLTPGPVNAAPGGFKDLFLMPNHLDPTMTVGAFVPPSTAGLLEFELPQSDVAAIVLPWAQTVVHDLILHTDEDIKRACKVLIQNSPRHLRYASQLLGLMERKRDAT